MLEVVRVTLLKLSRRQKRVLQVLADVVLLWLALLMAFLLRLGWDDLPAWDSGFLWLFVFAPLTAVPFLIRFGLYRAVLRYIGNEALSAMFKAISLGVLAFALVLFAYSQQFLIPRSVIFSYWWLCLVFLGGIRLLLRQFFLGDWFFSQATHKAPGSLPRVAIYGAGSSGNQLLAALRQQKSLLPVAFIDDDPTLHKRVIAGLRVYSRQQAIKMFAELGVQEILLAMPSASRARRREVIESLEDLPVHVRTVPGIVDIASGRVDVADLQEVDIVDLLGRDAVAAEHTLLHRCIEQQAVMVTGAGGSIGSELCRQILAVGPRTLILFEHSEYNLYAIHAELQAQISRQGLTVALVPILGSVRDVQHVLKVLKSWQVNTVYHAAAYKHVPMVEHNVAEGVLNNVTGTLNVACAAIEAGVANFVLISTDKAVRPTNVMGSTKRLAEMVLQALSRESRVASLLDNKLTVLNRTRFTMVRFGNVLGSSGSVIPLFREQIRKGGPVTVTHPKITRYFMTIPEAAQLVIQAGSMGQGGDVFVLDMGEPVEIVDLAKRMIMLSGLTVRDDEQPDGDIAIEFTGLRPGEKLYEELLIGDNVAPTEHPKIMRAEEELMPWPALRHLLDELNNALQQQDIPHVRQLLRQGVKGYQPESAIVDWLYQHGVQGKD
ncbi:polysaccharide biosynthesis protein [Atopomonas hussainii]|uniref:polysaccharide biosynthesis protein n=1 Tax=Atopomonas hussainii TaxID=1429083 RepID=UPI0009002959|nr:nucleoside-diphosphate sugar epimerase/dehydratase [Atopomonas hussainii]